jgi:hypothetical protein
MTTTEKPKRRQKSGGVRERKKLMRVELMMMLASKTESWKRQLQGRERGLLPVADWPPDDPLVVLMRTYSLTPDETADILDTLGSFLENKAIAEGYDETYTHSEPT